MSLHPVQGWSSLIPKFSLFDFISFYIEIPIIAAMFVTWMLLKRPRHPNYNPLEGSSDIDHLLRSVYTNNRTRSRFHDLVDAATVDLFADEYTEEEQSNLDTEDEETKRKTGRMKLVWSLYYWLI